MPESATIPINIPTLTHKAVESFWLAITQIIVAVTPAINKPATMKMACLTNRGSRLVDAISVTWLNIQSLNAAESWQTAPLSAGPDDMGGNVVIGRPHLYPIGGGPSMG